MAKEVYKQRRAE